MNEVTTTGTETPAQRAEMTSSVSAREGLALEAEVDGFVIGMDADIAAGGTGKGPRPKALVLTALCGCTAMDVIAILQKMRIHPERFTVRATATVSDEHPKVFERIELRYDFTGQDLPAEKLQRAVKLSQEKYCAVSAMLRRSVQLARTIYVNGAFHCHAEDPAPTAPPTTPTSPPADV